MVDIDQAPDRVRVVVILFVLFLEPIEQKKVRREEERKIEEAKRRKQQEAWQTDRAESRRLRVLVLSARKKLPIEPKRSETRPSKVDYEV